MPAEKRKRSPVDYDDDRLELDEALDDEEGVEGVREYLDQFDDCPESIPYKNKECRPTWLPGIYDLLVAHSKKLYKGQIVCGICGEDIAVDGGGNEITDPKLGYKNTGRPHIDHYKMVWTARKKQVDTLCSKGNWGPGKYSNALREAFNSPYLQIAHKQCNLKKGDTKDVTNLKYDKCCGEIQLIVDKRYK